MVRVVRERKRTRFGLCLAAVAGFAYAIYGFAMFARNYSTAESKPGFESCYCFSAETWANITFPSTLHFSLGVILMVVALVLAARVGK